MRNNTVPSLKSRSAPYLVVLSVAQVGLSAVGSALNFLETQPEKEAKSNVLDVGVILFTRNV